MRKTPLKSARRRARGNGDDARGVPHSPTGEQNQKKRTFDVLPKPDKLIRYRQAAPATLHELCKGVRLAHKFEDGTQSRPTRAARVACGRALELAVIGDERREDEALGPLETRQGKWRNLGLV